LEEPKQEESLEPSGEEEIMKAAISTLLTMLVLVAAATTTAAQTPVFVPGNASGCFGNPADQCVPLVAALTVSGPGWITVTYVSGTVTDAFGISTGPDGVTCNRQTAGRSACGQLPLNEANGVWFKSIPKLDALIGVFVPQSRVQRNGFNALDGTKGVTRAGIMPNGIFFIGTRRTFWAFEAGTLFLGINDYYVGDNSGGFNVTVTGP
jgi:hypothetical protein